MHKKPNFCVDEISDMHKKPCFFVHMNLTDFGNYRKVLLDRKKQWEEIDQFITRFTDWLAKNAPEYATDLKEKRLCVKNIIFPKEKDDAAEGRRHHLAE
jgi:hypothetical protein